MSINTEAIIIQALLDYNGVTDIIGTSVYNQIPPTGFTPPGIVVAVLEDRTNQSIDGIIIKAVDFVVFGENPDAAQELFRALYDWYLSDSYGSCEYGRIIAILPYQEDYTPEEQEILEDVNWTFIRTSYEVWMTGPDE